MENSKKWLRAIREVVQANRLFHLVYRDIIPPGIAFDDTRTLPRWWKWNDEEVVFQRRAGIPEASLTAMGVGTASTGGHWTRIIKDDLISEEAKLSESVMQRVREWFDSSLPLEKPPYKGNDLVVCTPWTYNDVYRYILEKYEYKLYRRSALEEDAEGNLVSLLPGHWSVEELVKEQERDPYYFSSQLMCRPRAGREVSFQPEWLRWGRMTGSEGEESFTIRNDCYDPQITEADAGVEPPQRVELRWMNKAILVDPAASDQTTKERSYLARTGIIVAGMDPWGRCFILDCWAGRRDPTDEIGWMLSMAQEWGVGRVAIEEVTFSNMYRHFLQIVANKRDIPITITPLKPGKRDKETRVQGLIPGFRAGLWYLNDTSALQRFKQEYLDFPYGKTRDLLDALAYYGEVLRRPETPEERDERRDMARSRVWPYTTVDPITGY
jgi:hypothetical protein